MTIIENHTGVAVGDYAKLTLPNGSTRFAKITAMHDDNSFNYTDLPTGEGEVAGGPNWQIEKLPVRSTYHHGDDAATTPNSLIYVLSEIDSTARQFIGKVVRTVGRARSQFVRVPYEDGVGGGFGAAVATWVLLEQGVSAGESLGDALVANADAQVAEVKASEEVGIITDLQAQVARLTGERDTLTHALTRANERFDQRDNEFRDSIDTIGARLLQEAEGRNWCSEFNDIVEEVNGDLPVYKLPMREQEYDVEVEVEGRMRTIVRLRITAVSQDEADEEGMGMNASQIDDNLTDRGEDSIDAQLTQRASRRSFDDLEVVER